MKNSLKFRGLQRDNEFDSLRLKVPSSVFAGFDKGCFVIKVTKNAKSGEEEGKDDDGNPILYLNEKYKGQGLNDFRYVPKEDVFDLQISAKILRENYYKGIRADTAIFICKNLEERGIVWGTNPERFMTESQVLRADNTFNIELGDGETDDYYRAMSMICSKSSKGKIAIYENEEKLGNVTGVVLSKDTLKMQKITIYNKIEEANSIWKKKYFGKEFDASIEEEYGMKTEDFKDYFSRKLRVECRITDFKTLRDFYTSRSANEVYLVDLILSKNNCILYQYNKIVSEMDTNRGIEFLSQKMEARQATKDKTFQTLATYLLIRQFAEEFDGDEVVVRDRVKKLAYERIDGSGYKQISPSVVADIKKYCMEWREEQRKKELGDWVERDLVGKYRHIEGQIKEL